MAYRQNAPSCDTLMYEAIFNKEIQWSMTFLIHNGICRIQHENASCTELRSLCSVAFLTHSAISSRTTARMRKILHHAWTNKNVHKRFFHHVTQTKYFPFIVPAILQKVLLVSPTETIDRTNNESLWNTWL